MHASVLVRQLVDGADAHFEVRAGVRGLAGDLEVDEQAALAAGHRRPRARPGSELKHNPRRTRELLDDRAARTASRSPRRR